MSALIAKLHVAKKQLGLDDDAYRAVLISATGKASSKGLSVVQLNKALDAFRALGFLPVPKAAGQRPKHVKLIYALWGELQTLGVVVKGPAGAKALRAFVKRQANVNAPEWLDTTAAVSVTEALKSWIRREKEKRS